MKTLLKLLALGLLIYIAFYVMFSSPKTSGQHNSAFDHSVCQYPNRVSNPADGCDNTDPANPAAAAKGEPENVTSHNMEVIGK